MQEKIIDALNTMTIIIIFIIYVCVHFLSETGLGACLAFVY